MRSIYDPPDSDLGPARGAAARRLRQEGLPAEGRVLDLGRLCRGLGLPLLVLAVARLSELTDPPWSALLVLRSGLRLVGAVLMVWGGHQLVRLRPRGRGPTLWGLGLTALSGWLPALMLFGFGLWALLSARGRAVFGAEQGALRDSTPQLRAGSSAGALVLVALGMVLASWLLSSVLAGLI